MRFWLGLLAIACTDGPVPTTGSTADTAAPTASGYTFPSRDGSGRDSVAYDGQTIRHVLIADLETWLRELTPAIDGGSVVPAEGSVRDALMFFLAFDSSTSGAVSHRVSTDPAPLQTVYDDIATDKDLLGKLAGNDSVTDHRDWTTELVGWPGAASPEALVRDWVDAIDAAAVDRANGIVPVSPGGAPITRVYVDPRGRDLQELLDKFLRAAVAFSQGADDYLDDDVDGKGLLADHAELVEGAPYTALEHAWDEGFGYFGASRTYGAWTLEQRAASTVDVDSDGAIDLTTEKVWHAANYAASRDAGSATATTLGDDAFDAFVAGRALLASADGPLDATQLDELRGHRDAAVLAWERALAASVIHYLNELVADQDAMGTDDYTFEDHAKHWSEAKGTAMAFQFDPRSPLTDEQLEQLHSALGTAPVVEDGGEVSLADYRAGVLQVRDLLGSVYGFQTQDVTSW